MATQQPIEQGDSAKLRLLNSIQDVDTCKNISVYTKKTQFYRKNKHNTKSKRQYWKERNRRKQTWTLSSKGYTYPEIAEKLGVSAKTVQRDMKKLRRYYIGQFNKSCRIMHDKRIEMFEKSVEGLNPAQRFKVTTALLCDYMDRQREREYKRHLIKITVDMDHWIGDNILPHIITYPKKNFNATFPLHLELAYRVKGEIIKCGGFTLG